jgi:LPPG:FO 2-phospho-L-lactate transferase
MLRGLVQVTPPERVTAIVNTADDTVLHGLRISPDLDTVVYTLAGAINPETGWGLAGESWQAMEALERYGGLTWFRLGDRDLGTHLYRTHRLSQGATLSTITAEIARAHELELAVIPVTDDRIATRVRLAETGPAGEAGTEIGFQEYFVQHAHSVPISGVRFDGAQGAVPAPGVLDALDRADAVVIAPSNPIVSIGPLLAVAGVSDAITTRRDHTVAVSPIIGGAALKGPADRMLRELGMECSALGVARAYRELASVMVVDDADRDLAPAIEELGMRCVVTPTIMSGSAEAAALARVVVESVS